MLLSGLQQEAFVHSMSTAAQLRAQNKWLLFFSLVSLAVRLLLCLPVSGP